MNMKTKLLLIALAMSVAVNAQTENTEVTVGDVSNTDCASRTRAESVIGHPTLKLTRNEYGLLGELNDFEVNCAYGDITVICKEEGQSLAISVDEGISGASASCICQINIYFTIFNALKDEYQLTMKGRNVGTVSFKDHSVVEIDLKTLEQAYEEGFDYPVRTQNFFAEEKTNYVKPSQDLSQSLSIDYYGDKYRVCCFGNYILPREYSYLDVQAETDKDGTVVINVLTDGLPDKNSGRVADLFFDLVNLQSDNYHLRLNHTVLAGSPNECTVTLFEGDITLVEDGGEIVSTFIPINDLNDYKAIVANIHPQHLTDKVPNAPYYDLQGRKLTSKPSSGIYILRGQKKLAGSQ